MHIPKTVKIGVWCKRMDFDKEHIQKYLRKQEPTWNFDKFSDECSLYASKPGYLISSGGTDTIQRGQK